MTKKTLYNPKNFDLVIGGKIFEGFAPADLVTSFSYNPLPGKDDEAVCCQVMDVRKVRNQDKYGIKTKAMVNKEKITAVDFFLTGDAHRKYNLRKGLLIFIKGNK